MFLTKKRTGSFFRINIFYSIIWTVVSALSFMNPLKLIMPRQEIFYLVCGSILLFNIIYLLFYKKNVNNAIDFSKYIIKEQYIVFINVAAYLLLIPVFISVIQFISSNGFNLLSIRDEIYVGITDSNDAVLAVLCRAIPTAIFVFTELLSSYFAVVKKNKRIVFLGVFDVLIGTIIFGGRNFVLNFVVFYFLHFVELRKQLDLKLDRKIILIGIVVLALITGVRDVNNLSLFETTTLYYAGSLSFLEYIISNSQLYGLSIQHFGSLTFGFITEPIAMLINFLFGSNIKVPSYYFNIYAQKFVDIGATNKMLYNNNSTVFYPFMLDFGISGALIGSVFYYLIIMFVDRLKQKGNLRYYFIAVYIYSTVINSSISYKLIGITAAVVFLLCFFCIKKKDKHNG